MISRVIEARPDDLRAFLEEAAGISRYKERRRETENRIGHTRENLDRLNDLREEVEKQIRHLQRQAATARRYQALKEERAQAAGRVAGACACRRWTPRRACAMRRPRAARPRCRRCSRICAKSRRRSSGFASSSPRKADASARSRRASTRPGAEVTRIEQSIQHARELRQRQRADLEQAEAQVTDSARRDRSATAASSMRWRAELATMVPGLDARARAESCDARGAGALRAGARRRGSTTWDAHAAGGGARVSARRRSSARASNSSRASSAACCSSRIGRRRSARRSPTCSRRCRWNAGGAGDARRASGPEGRGGAAGTARRIDRRARPRARADASARTRCAPAGSRPSARRSPPRRCSRRRSARPPARSRSG